MVTWVGLLLYEISTFAPTGGVTVRSVTCLGLISDFWPL